MIFAFVIKFFERILGKLLYFLKKWYNSFALLRDYLIKTKMAKTLINLKDINLTYNRNKPNAYQALFDINLEIEENSFVIIFGPSGCGKSSLLNTISGLELPDSGEVIVGDKNLLEMSAKEKARFHRKSIGMIFQSYNLIPTLSVLDNVVIPQIFINNGRKMRERRAMRLLDRFGIKEHAHKIPTELSGGEQQRIGIARAIINKQPILLADEPVGNLDSKSAGNVMKILSNLNKKENKTIIMVSHNPDNIIWGDHIIYMRDGKIVNQEFRDTSGEVKETDKSKKDEMDKLESLFRNFQGLSKEQIKMLITPMKAKILTRSLLLEMDERQIKLLEDTVRQRILNTINKEELYERLDNPEDLGGLDMDARTAKKISKKIEEFIEVAHTVSATKKIDTDKRTEIVLKYLLSQGDIIIKFEQLSRLRDAVKHRMINKIDREKFQQILDMPERVGGVGFNKKTAKKIAKKMDLILMIGYGMS